MTDAVARRLLAGFIPPHLLVWTLPPLLVTRRIAMPGGALVVVVLLEGVLFLKPMTPSLCPDLIEVPLWGWRSGPAIARCDAARRPPGRCSAWRSLLGLLAVLFLAPSATPAGLRRLAVAWSALFVAAAADAALNGVAPYAGRLLAARADPAAPARHLLRRLRGEGGFAALRLSWAILYPEGSRVPAVPGT
ncbi:MAG: hypothetical protein U1E53_27480 [Dongiaceae bacterium]